MNFVLRRYERLVFSGLLVLAATRATSAQPTANKPLSGSAAQGQ